MDPPTVCAVAGALDQCEVARAGAGSTKGAAGLCAWPVEANHVSVHVGDWRNVVSGIAGTSSGHGTPGRFIQVDGAGVALVWRGVPV
jgi:hypothetical protein